MTDQNPAPEPARRFDQLFATDDEPVRIPDWMRHPVQEHELTRAERLRLGWDRHSGKLLAGVGALLVVGLLAVVGAAGWGFVDKVHRGEGILPTRSAQPPRPVDGNGNTLGVFLGTPAESFAEGEAGIVLPAARATGPFTAKQVTAALAAVRGALVEGRLRSRMLGGDPQPFLAGLAPDARARATENLTRGSALGFATRIAPDADPRWVPEDGIRVRGTVEYAAGTTDEGVRVLNVTTRFIWVYSFDLLLAQQFPPGAELVTVRDQVVWQFPHPADVRPATRGLWVGSADVTVAGAPCAALRKGYLALENDPAHRPLLRPGPAPTADVYDPGWEPGDGEDC
ncbi:hypothetical protein [Micromonospora auratinigra]|uniref:Uncharacterized protein n=1 Tax=Micromonospora auratinigra TaxID=261654 RepID=A0A1A9AB39_9ACTN|nr:hypothetical protein [Micromonospora auratinigra]SBT53361.1 hypothetical protein GA0070611_6083 [Micromonospora auratinigra]